MHLTSSLLGLLALSLSLLTHASYADPRLPGSEDIGAPHAPALKSCADFFNKCRYWITWPASDDIYSVITEFCWPFATEQMRALRREPAFLCPRKIHVRGLGSHWPMVREETWRLYGGVEGETGQEGEGGA
ncbi:MAG: hypothetical protein M1829_005402 [Trizodia sp. TS-e1964]|nr:MAG: hypothetical protein M1829_005402 [Trizodia sp. TS-e1964]